MTDHDKAIEAAARALADNHLAVSDGHYQHAAQTAITAYLAALGEAGSVVVPVEATPAMIDAGFDHHPKHFEARMGRPPTPEEDMGWQYRAMLAARPRIAEAKE